MSIAANSLSLNGGTIKDGADNDAGLEHHGRLGLAVQRVDGVKPMLAATDPVLVNGERLTLAYDETIETRPPVSAFSVTGGSSTRIVSAVSSTGSALLLILSPAVAHGRPGSC